MSQLKARRAAAAVLLVSAFSVLPVQAAGMAARARAPRHASLSAGIGNWQSWTWELLVDLFGKRGASVNPDGARINTDGDGPH